MADFDDELIATASDHLSGVGEAVKYKPGGGGERLILAFIDREPPQEGGTPQGHSPMAVIYVENNNTDGISSEEIDLSADKVEYAVRLNKQAEDRRITNIIDQDAGMLTLELR